MRTTTVTMTAMTSLVNAQISRFWTPRPTQLCLGLFWAATPKGTMPCRIPGKPVCMSVCPSIYLLPPTPASSGQIDGRTDGWRDVHTDFPYILQDIIPLGSCYSAFFQTATIILISRASVPLTISCLWATVFLFLSQSLSDSLYRYASHPRTYSNGLWKASLLRLTDRWMDWRMDKQNSLLETCQDVSRNWMTSCSLDWLDCVLLLSCHYTYWGCYQERIP